LDAEDELPEEGKLAEMIGKSTNEETNMEPEELEKRLESLEAVAKAGPAEARYMADKELDLDGRVEFMGKSDDERTSTLKAEGYIETKEDNVNKAEMPEEMRKRFEDMEKRAKEAEDIAKAEREAREFDALKKRAETEYPHLKGDAETKAKVLKALESSDEEVAKSAKEMLKAADEATSQIFAERGVTGSDSEESAEGQLNKMAKEKSESEGTTFAKAYSDVLQTDKGMELYNQYVQEG
jgi:hypothetical protein